MNLIDCIRNNNKSSIIKKCSENNCTLKLNNLSDYILLKGEKLCRDRKICDCIIFKEQDKVIIGLAELKSKSFHAKDIKEKFENAIKIVQQILKQCHNKRKVRFYCLLLSKRCSTSEHQILTKTKISTMGKKHHILPLRCGVSFSDIISKF